jgi:hypothetical protein
MTARRTVSAKDGAGAIAMLDSEKRVTAKNTPAEGRNKCIGSARFGIDAHEAPVGDFPIQPSQRDGLGRMCKPHWRAYTNGLRKAALVRAAAAEAPADAKAERPAPRPRQTATKPEPIRTRPARGRKTEGELVVAAGEANVEEASIA